MEQPSLSELDNPRVDYTTTQVRKGLSIEGMDLDENPNAAYTAIPLRLDGDPQAVQEILSAVLKEVMDVLDGHEDITVVTGDEAQYAFSIALTVNNAIKQQKEADRAARQ